MKKAKRAKKEEAKKRTLKRFIGRFCLNLLVFSMIPYRFKKDAETDALEVRSLLWGVRKTPCEGKDRWAFAIPPSGLDMEEETE